MQRQTRPGDNLSFPKEGRHHNRIVLVASARPGIIGVKDIAFVDAGILRKALDNVADSSVKAQGKNKDVIADTERLASGCQQRRVDIEGLINGRRPRSAHGHLDLLVVDRLQTMAEDLQSYGVNHCAFGPLLGCGRSS